MHSRGLVVLLIPLILAGCVAPPEAPAAAPDGPPADTDLPSTSANRTLPNLTVQVADLRAHPFDAPRIRIEVAFDRPLSAETELSTAWTRGDDDPNVRTETVPANATSWNVTHELPLGHGNHTLQAQAYWGTSPEVDAATQQTYTVWAPVRLILNASEKYASEQNAFLSDHLVPFAPWDDESALHILRRAASTYAFDVKTHYRADFDSHFIDAINGTAFEWELEPAGISRNWMILLDDTATRHAVDDTFPEPDQTLEFRYVRCYATGNCDDL